MTNAESNILEWIKKEVAGLTEIMLAIPGTTLAEEAKKRMEKLNKKRAEILKNESGWMEVGVTTLEDAAYSPTWCHLDIRDTGLDNIFIVKP